MHFKATEVAFLQRLASERPAGRKNSAAATFFCREYGIGTLTRSSIVYSQEDWQAARHLLQTHGLPIAPVAQPMTRAEAASFGGMSEKSFSKAPHADSIAIKTIGGCTLDGRLLASPEGGYLVLHSEQVLEVLCQRLMVVENLETFRRLHCYRWIDYQELDVLVIYRGDTIFSPADAAAVIKDRRESIWCFLDFDPAGLAIANALADQRLERLIHPGYAWLEPFAKTERGLQLFDSQLRFSKGLDAATNPLIIDAWGVMSEWRGAVAQEGWEHA